MAGGLGGEVLITYFESGLGPQPAIWARRSSDHGANFDGPAAAAVGYADDPDIKIGNLGVAHVAFAKQSSGNFYNMAYVWSPGPPYTTWSDPVMVNDGGFRRNQLTPSLALQRCGTTAVLHLIWSDTRLSPAASPERYEDIFYSRKVAKAGEAWSKNVRISNVSSLADNSSYYVKKEPDLTVSAGRLFAVWTDRRDKTDPNDHETDVYGSGILSGVTCR